MKICTVVGARPQFIKAAVLSKALCNYAEVEERLIHTGQHYDDNMSKVFFDELEIRKPDFNLGVGSGTHAFQTAQILINIEKLFVELKPDWVVVYGDTNSTLAASLAAAKLHIKVAHVEAGLRSFNMAMPEEINRITTDRISDILFAPTENAVKLLGKEGISKNVVFSGDVMYDSILYYSKMAERKYLLNEITELNDFYLATIHRAENTDVSENLKKIFEAFSELDKMVILPLHPRTKSKLSGLTLGSNIKIIEPVSYLKMILLLGAADKVLTDSGGLQKEAFFMKKQCVTLRTETEWIETLNGGWNVIANTDKNKILEAIKSTPSAERGSYFGNGNAGEKIAESLLNYEQKF